VGRAMVRPRGESPPGPFCRPFPCGPCTAPGQFPFEVRVLGFLRPTAPHHKLGRSVPPGPARANTGNAAVGLFGSALRDKGATCRGQEFRRRTRPHGSTPGRRKAVGPAGRRFPYRTGPAVLVTGQRDQQSRAGEGGPTPPAVFEPAHVGTSAEVIKKAGNRVAITTLGQAGTGGDIIFIVLLI